MNLENERKFLVDPSKLPLLPEGERTSLVYLTFDPAIRVGTKGNLTIKFGTGQLREEFVFPLPMDQAVLLLERSPYRIERIRYLLPCYGLWLHNWEIDQYLGENTGLWTAEIEYDPKYEDQLNDWLIQDRPEWLLSEVTEKPAFRNTDLCRWPFNSWEKLR